MNRMLRTLTLGLCLAGLLAPLTGLTKESIPPRPERYFTDYAGEVSPAVAHLLNERLGRLAGGSSCPIVVVVFGHMESDSDIADYTRRVAQAWGIDETSKNSGVAVFVYPKKRQGYIQVGQGLKNKIPDLAARHIVEEQLIPHLERRDCAGGVSATITALTAAAKPPHQSSGNPIAQTETRGWGGRRKAVMPESAANAILIIAGVIALGIAAVWFWIGGFSKGYNPKYADRLVLLHKIMFFEITSSRRRKRLGSRGSRKSQADGPPFQGGGADAEW